MNVTGEAHWTKIQDKIQDIFLKEDEDEENMI